MSEPVSPPVSPSARWTPQTTPEGRTFYYNEALGQSAWNLEQSKTEMSEATALMEQLNDLKLRVPDLTERIKVFTDTSVQIRTTTMTEESAFMKTSKDLRTKCKQLEIEAEDLAKSSQMELAAIDAITAEKMERFQQAYDEMIANKASYSSKIEHVKGSVIPRLKAELEGLQQRERDHAGVVRANKVLTEKISVLAQKLRTQQEVQEWNASRLNMLLCPTCMRLQDR